MAEVAVSGFTEAVVRLLDGRKLPWLMDRLEETRYAGEAEITYDRLRRVVVGTNRPTLDEAKRIARAFTVPLAVFDDGVANPVGMSE